MRVAIIGAGVSGLASARYALEFNLECVIFEARDSLGGTWLYTEEVPVDDYNVAVHANIYKSLRVNFPTQLMEFSEYKFEPKSGSNFPLHTEVLEYLEDFAEEFKLYPLIKFQHLVQHVFKEMNNWKIIVKNLENNQIKEEYFDAVMICNGHNAKPNIPYIPGIESFEGEHRHSHYYKHNGPFKDKKLLIIGQGPSGFDISLECAEVANKVYICCRSEWKPAIFVDKIEIKPAISKILSNSVIFTDETTVEIDSIIFCTGFQFHFPFLDKSCGIEVSEDYIVRPLHNRFINILHPSMCIIGLFMKSVVFPLVDLQAKVFLKHLIGQIDLPPTDLMLKWEEEENKIKVEMKVPPSKYHFIGEETKSYMEELASLGQTETLQEVHFKIFNKSLETAEIDYELMKKQVFKIIDKDTYLWEINKH